MAEYTIIVTSTFGLEAVVARELQSFGYSDLMVENGRVVFKGDEKDIAKCNIRLRAADRVHIKLAEFKATDFEDLFQGTLKVKWDEIIPLNGKMHVTGKSIKSSLFSISDCQSIVKKGVVEAMKRKYHRALFPETGPVYKIEISLLKDIATLTIDTTGDGLHKRGYRRSSGEAPLRETLAAGLVLLSRWNPERILADPFCGSGTIPIEAALIGKNMAPGLNRRFVSEDWPNIQKKIWDSERQSAYSDINDLQFRILASDIDADVLKKARENAINAGVGDCITFQRQNAEEFRSRKKYGCIICNPPYGERLGELSQVENLYKKMGRVFSGLNEWSFFILSAHPQFQKCFGKKADKNRKIFNGNIKCYYYSYTGALPPRKAPPIDYPGHT